MRQGNKVESWMTKPTCRYVRAQLGAAPKTATRPSVQGSRSATTRSKVDFPQPDGPMIVTKDPASIVSETS